MRVYTETITFDGGGAKQMALLSSRTRMARLYAEPDKANAHVCYVGDASLAIGTSTTNHVIKQLAKPTAVDAQLDNFEVEDLFGYNRVELAEFSFDGTSGEKIRLTVYEG